ncbi:MAG: thermonuclease family protein [Terricaulis sp.]
MGALAALFGALVLFWISTRQFRPAVRFLLWLGGAGLLAFAAQSTINSPDQFGLIHGLVAAADDNGESPIARALRLNASAVAPFLQQLMDFFVIAGAALGLLSLAAFSKGEALERFLRPTLFALAGFVGGSIATLAIVAIGFGGYMRPRAFTVSATEVADIRVHDGDTFRIGDYSLRLYGIDSPELDQICGLTGDKCGDAAREELNSLLQHGVQCDQTLSRKGRVRDALGRPLVRCLIPRNGGSVDLSQELVRLGYAVQYQGDDYGYGAQQQFALQTRAGIMGDCSLRPDVWRDGGAIVAAFKEHQLPPRGTPMMGACASSTPRAP